MLRESREFTSQDEADSRNFVLSRCHGRIPSYALWDALTVSNEDEYERIKWWKFFIKSDKTDVAQIAMMWVERLELLCIPSGCYVEETRS